VALKTVSLVLTLVVFVGHKTLASRPRRDLEEYITGFNIGNVRLQDLSCHSLMLLLSKNIGWSAFCCQ